MLLSGRFPENLLESLETSGFCLLRTSEEARKSVELVLKEAYPFFRSAFDQKIANILPEDTGYRPFGKEYSGDEAHPDQLESFTVTMRHSIANLPSQEARLLANRMLTIFDNLEELAEQLTIRLAELITDQPCKNDLYGAFHRWSRLQLNYSRPKQVVPSFINATHEDGNLLTLACATDPGLEVRTRHGEFVPLMAGPGELVVMPGEIIWLLSGGRIPPLFHRVNPKPSCEERIALLFFGDINPSACEPWVENEFNRGVDIGRRVLTSVNRFGLKGFGEE